MWRTGGVSSYQSGLISFFSFLVHSIGQRPNLKLQFSCNNGTKRDEIFQRQQKKEFHNETDGRGNSETVVFSISCHERTLLLYSCCACRGTTSFTQPPSFFVSARQRLGFRNKAGRTLCSPKKRLIKLFKAKTANTPKYQKIALDRQGFSLSSFIIFKCCVTASSKMHSATIEKY